MGACQKAEKPMSLEQSLSFITSGFGYTILLEGFDNTICQTFGHYLGAYVFDGGVFVSKVPH